MSGSQAGNIMFPPWECLAKAASYTSTPHSSLFTFHSSLFTLHFSLAKRKNSHLSRRMPQTPLYKGLLPFSSHPSSLTYLSRHLSRHLSRRYAYVILDKGVTGEIREGYVRDKKNLSRAETPIYKGISSDDGRDGDIFST